MTNEASFLAFLAEDPGDETTRLVFADWLDERGDPRSAWLRDPDLARWSLPELVDPYPRLVAALGNSQEARRILVQHGNAAVPELLGACTTAAYVVRDLIAEMLGEIVESQPRLRALRLALAGDAASRETAIRETVELGREGLALLLDLTEYEQPMRLSVPLLSQLLAQPGVACPPVFQFLWNRIGYNNRHVASELFQAIQRDGPHPTNVRVLLSGLNNGGDISEYACHTLRELGPAIVPMLIASFEDAESDSFDWWVTTLTGFGPPVIPLLLDALDQEFAQHGDEVADSRPWQGVERALREMASEGQVGEHGPLLVERLTAIGAAAPSRIWYVLTTLMWLGPAARPAWPLVTPYLESSSPYERQAALQFLAILGEPDRYEADILASLQSGDPETRLRAVGSLSSLASITMERAAPLLRQALADPEAEVRERTLDQMMSPTFWPAHETAVPLFRQALADPEASLRARAVLGLCRHAERAGEVTSDLLRLLREDPSEEVRIHAASYLILAFPSTKTPEILAALCEATRDAAGPVRNAATMALRDWGAPLPEPAIAALIARLHDPVTLAQAAYALHRMPTLMPEATAALCELLHGDSPGNTLALDTLTAHGHAFRNEDIPALERILREGAAHHRALAIRHLQHLASQPST